MGQKRSIEDVSTAKTTKKEGNNPPTKKPEDPKKNTSKRMKIDDDLFIFIFPPSINGNDPPLNNGVKTKQETKIENVCRNPVCNHKKDNTPIDIPKLTEIKNINDLIELGKSFHCKKNTEFAGLNLRLLCNLVGPLTELTNMVGMENVKEQMTDQILHFLQGNHITNKCGKCTDCVFGLKCLNSQTDMLHTVITGPPGVGKTELGKILGKVYKEMGILSKDTFKLATRSDLVGQYLGQTAIKTQKIIDDCKGGVLFIDEAYSLGNSELRDSFSKECIDTLNQNLSERRDFLCIIAGYEGELEKCFFKYNEGLRRRFTFRYSITPYTPEELLQIFERKVKAIGWDLCYTENTSLRETVESIFKKNIKCFPNYGGDIETLLLNCKIVHTRRCTFNTDEARRVLSISDIENGLKRFSKNRKYDNTKQSTNESEPSISMYSFK